VFTHYFRLAHRGAAGRERCALLERLLAGAGAPAAVGDWRAAAFNVIAPTVPMPGIGAAALCAEGGVAVGSTIFLATPVHYVAELNNVRLPVDGILTLSQPEAVALAADFNRVWQGAGMRLLAGRCAALYCAIDEPIAAATCDPEHVLGRHIAEGMPTGGGAAPLRRLMSEIEMWLFEHAVNQTRRAHASPELSGLWLWGGGPSLDALPAVDGWTAGDDPLFKSFGARGLSEHAARARAAPAVLVISAEPGTDQWREAESRWLLPSVADLRAGRIGRIQLSAGNLGFSIRARWRWRFVRRRPWWESFA